MTVAFSPRPLGDRVTLRELLPRGTVHFMGVGGAGMCALAEAIVRRGGRVTGCDLAPGEAVKPLERMGIRVWTAHDPAHVQGAVGLVVSAAVPTEHPELAAAREAGIPVWKRARALGEWVDQGSVVAVAGTHGKTTTTAMITDILALAGRDPTGFVGGRVAAWGGHLRPGGEHLFVVEADEFDRSFHHLHPSIALVTNLDADHLDIYGNLEGVVAGFARFLEGVKEDGTVLVCADDPGAAGLVPRLSVRVRSYGFSAGSQLRGTRYERDGEESRFGVLEDGEDRGWIRLRVAGRHNATNALGAAAVARTLGVGWPDIRMALGAFLGVARRFQLLGEPGGIAVVDDYAHHPKEIAAALAAARESYPGRRLVVAFQPHLFTRTRDFARGFGEALAAADVVWITEIYPAREAPIPGVDGRMVAREVEAAVERGVGRAGEIYFHADLASFPEVIVSGLRPGDLCLTLGAGSVERVGPDLLTRLETRAVEGAHA